MPSHSRKQLLAITNCPIREHTGDGAYVGRCDFAIHDGECPRHGRLADYPTLDDRELAVDARRWTPKQRRWRRFRHA